MGDKVDRFSNTPLETWPRVGWNMQVGLLLNKILSIPVIEAVQLAGEYTDEEALSFIRANLDTIKDRV